MLTASTKLCRLALIIIWIAVESGPASADGFMPDKSGDRSNLGRCDLHARPGLSDFKSEGTVN